MARIKKYYSVLILSAVVDHGHTQQNTTSISISDELVNNEVTAIIQDKNGLMWFGTRGGLQRYDGYKMKLPKIILKKVVTC